MTPYEFVSWAFAVVSALLLLCPFVAVLGAGVYFTVEWVRSWFTKEDA